MEKIITELKGEKVHQRRAYWTLQQISAFMEIEKIKTLQAIIDRFKKITSDTKRKKFAIEFLTNKL